MSKYIYDAFAKEFPGTVNRHTSRKWLDFCSHHSISDTSAEMMWRIRHRKVGVDFNCKGCNGPIPFRSGTKGKVGFKQSYCSVSCAQQDRDPSTFRGFACEEGYQKSRDTLVTKYGVTHQAQIPEVHERSQAKRYKSYTVVSPSGLQYTVQGYERYVIPMLWEEVGESDLLVKRSDIPKVMYRDMDGVERRYYPDAMILSTNTMIEVKSAYTLEDPLLPAKILGTQEAGYNIEVITYDNGMDIQRTTFHRERL